MGWINYTLLTYQVLGVLCPLFTEVKYGGRDNVFRD
jgi:hypothetical protein